MKLVLAAAALAALTGCAYNLTLMPRDSGKMYTGELQSDGSGSGTVSVSLDGATCTGPAARVSSNQTFGFANTYGNRGSAMTTFAGSGDVAVKAILTCSDSRGLRCELTGQGSSGGGICLDDAGRVYDVLARRR